MDPDETWWMSWRGDKTKPLQFCSGPDTDPTCTDPTYTGPDTDPTEKRRSE